MKQGRVHGHGDEVLRVLVKAVRIKAGHRYGSSPAQTDAGNSHRIRTLVTGIYIGGCYGNSIIK